MAYGNNKSGAARSNASVAQDYSLLSQLIFPTKLLSLPSKCTGLLSSSPRNNLNLSPPFNLFFSSSPTIPGKMIFLPSS